MKKMNNINKLKYLGNLKLTTGDKYKNYMIYIKITDSFKCNLITKSLYDITLNLETNPPLNIINIDVNGKKLNIIQDDILMAGTKTRVAELFVKEMLKINPNIKTIVYAGTFNGYGHVATAYACYKLNLECKVFLSKIPTGSDIPSSIETIMNSRQVNTTLKLNGKIYLCENYRDARNLEYDYSTNITDNNKKWKNKKDYLIVPMGLNDENGIMIKLLSKQIKDASNNINPKNIWLVAGSGGIAMSISNAFPNSNIYIYLTGGGKYKDKVIEWSKNNSKIKIVNNMDITNVENDYYKYYKSVKNYDDKIFPFVKKYGKDGDYVWNVASD